MGINLDVTLNYGKNKIFNQKEVTITKQDAKTLLNKRYNINYRSY